MRYYVHRCEIMKGGENRVINGYNTEPQAIEKFHEFMRDDIHNENCLSAYVFVANQYGVIDDKHKEYWERPVEPTPEPETEE